MLSVFYCHVFHVSPDQMYRDGVLSLEDCKATWKELKRLYENGTFSSGHAAAEHIYDKRSASVKESESSPAKLLNKQLDLFL